MNQSAVGQKIRQRRKSLGITQANLAKLLDISASYLNLIESNKRAVGGKLLSDLAGILELDLDVLSGAVERRLRDDLREIPSVPLLSHINFEKNFADVLVAQNPEWARTILALYRAFLDRDKLSSVMSDRLNLDPQLQSEVHKMLTHITSIRSTSEILNSAKKINSGQSDSFHNMLQLESIELTNVAQRIISSFEKSGLNHSNAAAAEQVDEFIIAHQNFFPTLEETAQELRSSISKIDKNDFDGALAKFLQNKLAIKTKRVDISNAEISLFHNQTLFDRDNKTLHFLANAPNTTRRFQMIKVAAELIYKDTLLEFSEDSRLTTRAARDQAINALASYISGAVVLPYQSFLTDAEKNKYDIEILRQKYNAGYEQICHRLITLRDPSAEGVPFAFLRSDPSGHISKRFPLAQFPLPRYGHACPLWTVFSAFQSPGRIIRHISEFPNGHQYLMIARTVSKRGATFHDEPVLFAIMLACDAIHADRTVYAAGLDLSAENAARQVGPACSQCTRSRCSHRQESSWTLLQ